MPSKNLTPASSQVGLGLSSNDLALQDQTTRQKRVKLHSSIKDRNKIQRHIALSNEDLGSHKANTGASKRECWKDEAWDSYDNVEVVGQAVDTVAKGVAKGKLFVAIEGSGCELLRTEAELPNQVLCDFKGPKGKGYKPFLYSAAQVLQVSGDGYFIAHKVDPNHRTNYLGSENDGRSLYKEWEFVSDQEISVVQNKNDETLSVYRDDCGARQNYGSYGLTYFGSQLRKTDRMKLDREEWYVARAHRRHPRHSQLSDSALRKNLSTISKIRRLDNQIDASIDSKMYSKILLIPTQITLQASGLIANQLEVETQGAEPEYIDQLDLDLYRHYAMPIEDHADPVINVPFVIRGASEYLDNVRVLDISKNLDLVSHRMREELYDRLYVGLDIPREILEGKGTLNHWTGSNIDSNLTSNHVIPLGELIAELITENYLRPVLIQRGMSPAEAYRHHVVFDPSEILPRADRSTIACKLYELEVISERALLESSGFSITDAPSENERRQRTMLKLILSSPVTLAPFILPRLNGFEEIAEDLRSVAEERGQEGSIRNERSAETGGDDGRGRGPESLLPSVQDDNAPRQRSADGPPSERRRQDADSEISPEGLSTEEEIRTWIENNIEVLGHLSPLLRDKTIDQMVRLVSAEPWAITLMSADPIKASTETIYPMGDSQGDEEVDGGIKLEADGAIKLEDFSIPSEFIDSVAAMMATIRSQCLLIGSAKVAEIIKSKLIENPTQYESLNRIDYESPDCLSECSRDELDLLGVCVEEILECEPRDNLSSALLDTFMEWAKIYPEVDDEDSVVNLTASIIKDFIAYLEESYMAKYSSGEEALAPVRMIVQSNLIEFVQGRFNSNNQEEE